MAKLKDLKVTIGLSKKGLTKLNSDLRRTKANFRRNFGEIQGMVRNTGRAMTAGITAPLGLMAVQSVKAFDQQAKAIAQVEAGLKSTGAQVGFTSQQLQKMASDLQTKTLFGDEQILKDATAQLLTFTNIAGDQFSRTQSVALDLATRLDGDLKGASIQLGKALNDPIANLSALSRSGIQFSEEQKETIKSLAETNRLAEAQTVILDELEKQYGGSAEAAAQAGMGPFKQLQNTIGDLSEEFGKLIADVLVPLIPKITAVVRSVSNMSDGMKRSLLGVAAVLGAAGPIALAVSALMPIITALTGPIGLVVLAIGGIVTAVLAFRKEISGPLADAANFFIDIYNEVAPIRVAIAILTTAVQANFKIIRTAGLAVFDAFKSIGMALYELLVSGDLSAAKDVLTKGFSDIGDDIFDAAVSIGEDFATGITDGMRNRIERVDASDISDALDFSKFLGGGSGVGGAAAGGVASRMEEMTRRTSEAVTSANATIIGSYTEVAKAVKLPVDQMIVMGEYAAGQLPGFFEGAFSAIKDGTKSFGEFMMQTLERLLIKAASLAATFAVISLMFPGSAVASGGFGAFMKGGMGIPQMANGGLFTGASLAMVGEGPGTSAINPEVVAPLDKLQQMMGGGNVTVTGMIRGNDILLSNERSLLDRNRVRGF